MAKIACFVCRKLAGDPAESSVGVARTQTAVVDQPRIWIDGISQSEFTRLHQRPGRILRFLDGGSIVEDISGVYAQEEIECAVASTDKCV